MPYETIVYDKREAIATVTLNRPQVYNALSVRMGEEFCAALADVAGDPAIRAVVLTGVGNAFCSGGDLKAANEARARGEAVDYFRRLTDAFHRMIIDMRRLPKPILGSLNGPAGGGGFSLALACDLRIASDRCRLKQGYTSAGLTPDGGWTAVAPHLIGLAKASELVYLDPVISAEEALRLGLVNSVVTAEELPSETERLARQLADGPTQSFGRVKALLNASIYPQLEVQLERERASITESAGTPDFEEGVQAFVGKRAARFVGR
ncbi:MAG TPA: enoyl-CoA hydratase-related protein [Dehalococcoidia bacterium]|nr:enoyl-CoA hydratase-related protein [Dehalococcoidia bacterium]